MWRVVRSVMESSSSATGALRRLRRAIRIRARRKKPWDQIFVDWIAEAASTGKDPNDIGDLAWADDPLHEALEKYYLVHLNPHAVVLELGPGSGRLTRHVISRVREMILVDVSTFVCDWLRRYLDGKGRFRIYEIDRPSLPHIGGETVDVIFANGVFEHIDIDDLYFFAKEFFRVLRPGGVAVFNFDNIMSEEGMRYFMQARGKPGDRSVFRFYHPDVVRHVAEEIGFRTLRLATSMSRMAFIEIEKPEI